MRNSPCLLPYLLDDTCTSSFQYPTSIVRLPLPCFMLHVSHLCQLCPALCRHRDLRFTPCGTEGVNTRTLYLCVLFLPKNGAVVKEKGREGPEKKLQWARDWWKKCLHNFNCFPTILFLVELPWGERSRLYWGWEFVTLIMPQTI